MKKHFLFITILLLLLGNCFVYANNCMLCKVFQEYENEHAAQYHPITCIFCKREFNDGLSYDIITLQENQYWIHDEDSTGCLAQLLQFVANQALCQACKNFVTEHKKIKIAAPEKIKKKKRPCYIS